MVTDNSRYENLDRTHPDTIIRIRKSVLNLLVAIITLMDVPLPFFVGPSLILYCGEMRKKYCVVDFDILT